MLYPLIDARPRIKVRVENLPISFVPARPRFTSVPVDALFSSITEKATGDYVAVEKMRGEQDADYVLSVNNARRTFHGYDRDRFARIGINSRRAYEYATDYAASFSYDAGGDWNYDDERA